MFRMFFYEAKDLAQMNGLQPHSSDISEHSLGSGYWPRVWRLVL